METLITSNRSTRSKPHASPNWLDLPPDVMIQIFTRVGVVDLLHSAQLVCSYWRAVAKDPLLIKDPQLYRVIDLRRPWKCFSNSFSPIEKMTLTEKMACRAIRRSGGHLTEFSIAYFCTDTILSKLMNASFQLKCLRLGTCYYATDNCLLEVLTKLPFLEEIEFCQFPFRAGVIEVVGQFCPRLKSLRLIHAGVKNSVSLDKIRSRPINEEAFAIAQNVNPGLRKLQLFGNLMSNCGLEAILDRFPLLEYLDLRQCVNVELKGDLLIRCLRVRQLQLPNDSVDDYKFDAMVCNRN